MLANADHVAAVVENQETSNDQELCLTAGSSSEVDIPPITGGLNPNSSLVVALLLPSLSCNVTVCLE